MADMKKTLNEIAKDWGNSDPKPLEPAVSEIDSAWKRVEDLLEAVWESGRQSHDDLIHIDKITEIQTAVADLKKMLDEDESA